MTLQQIGERRKEEKYLVLKLEDIGKYLNETEKHHLSDICDTINVGRFLDGKASNHYVVINEDEPYSEKVWDLILGRDHASSSR